MSRPIIALILAFITSCATNPNPNGLILDYSDFGPQVIANEVLGQDWWQWQPHGDSRPTDYEIKVVVYTDTTTENIRAKFPVDPNQNKDYRYLEYENAVEYLDQHINDNVMEAVTRQLINTRTKIISHFAD